MPCSARPRLHTGPALPGRFGPTRASDLRRPDDETLRRSIDLFAIEFARRMRAWVRPAGCMTLMKINATEMTRQSRHAADMVTELYTPTQLGTQNPKTRKMVTRNRA